MKGTMTKNEFRTAMVVGWMLGMMALVIFSFYRFEKQVTYNKNLKQQETKELVESVKHVCHPNYPVIAFAIYEGKLVVECKTK